MSRGSKRVTWACVALAVAALALPVEAGAATTGARWAHPELRASVRAYPSTRSVQVARLHYLTEDGYAEVYAVYRSYVDVSGHTWYRIGIPMRPNGRSGWVRDVALGPVYSIHSRLVIDRARERATLYRSGTAIWTSPVGVGAASTPTPAGHYWIREKFRVSNPSGSYGPYAFGTSDYSTLSDWPGGGVIGIHGTDQPQLIPGHPSHGCTRVPNRAITKLYPLLAIGTPVEIR
jgi:hypothetical protein